MSGSARPFWWRAHSRDLPDSTGWTVISEADYQGREDRLTGHDRLPDCVPDWAEDVLRVARSVFLADKRVRRGDSPDQWTRHIRLSVPVTERAHWQSTAARRHLTTLLQTLTADTWQVDFRPLPTRHVQEAMPLAESECAAEVALFSGGLDSLSWAARRARAEANRPLLLVRFREIKLEDVQREVYAAVQRIATRPVILLPMSQIPDGDGSGTRLETSSRTRGLLYAAGAIHAAAAHGADQVHIPENGQIALNPPLSAARSAACSTRSVHPWTLHHLNALLAAVGGTVQVVNPLDHLTKGQVCGAALAAGLTPDELASTLSCGRPPVRRKDGPPIPNCGVCFPCLIRRSGLRHGDCTDKTEYETDPWENDLTPEQTEDWRALLRWLRAPYTTRDLIADTPLPPETDRAAAMDVIRRGREELGRLAAS